MEEISGVSVQALARALSVIGHAVPLALLAERVVQTFGEVAEAEGSVTERLVLLSEPPQHLFGISLRCGTRDIGLRHPSPIRNVPDLGARPASQIDALAHQKHASDSRTTARRAADPVGRRLVDGTT